jgi:hypothetical protein
MSSQILSSTILHYIHLGLEIPSAIQKVLFPSPALSVAQFLQFPLPPCSLTPVSYQPSAFFSCHAPTVEDVSLISKIPVPSVEMVKELHLVCKTTRTSGYPSVVCPHAPLGSNKYFPLWIITYWTEVINLRMTREPWVHAEATLRKRKKGGRHLNALIDKTYLALSTLQWSGDIQGFNEPAPMNQLAKYATHQWLSDIYENQMLDILQQKLLLNPATLAIEVGNLVFMHYIERGYGERDSGQYAKSKYFAQAHRVGELLSSRTRKSVLLLKNIDNKHWVALGLDFEESCIRYGDSLGGEAPPGVMRAVEWWTHYHGGRNFTHGKLDITAQLDSFSCGLLAYNALAHHANPERFPLISASAVDDGRLDILLTVIRQHSDHVVSYLSN